MDIITGIVRNTTPVYFGPNASLYPSQSSSAGPNDEVIVKWREGDWYYIDYPAGTNNRKCMYIPVSAVSELSGTPPTYNVNLITKTSIAATTYWGPGAAYPSAGSVGVETVYLLNGKMENGFSMIEYNISGGQKKRAWIMTPKLGTPTCNYTYRSGSYNGCTLHVLEADADDIVLTSLNRATTLSDAGYYGVNAGFFDMSGTVVTYQIAANNGFPVLFAVRNSSHNGDENVMGYGCLQWNGSSLNYIPQITYMDDLPANTIWAQGGIDLYLDKTFAQAEGDLNSQLGSLMNSASKRTAICATLSTNKVYMIVTSTSCSVKVFRQAVSDFLETRDASGVGTNTVGMILDGGGSSTLCCEEKTYDQGRNLVQCMVLKN